MSLRKHATILINLAQSEYQLSVSAYHNATYLLKCDFKHWSIYKLQNVFLSFLLLLVTVNMLELAPVSMDVFVQRYSGMEGTGNTFWNKSP